ncbi:MAG: MBL fold metallo-hydrolase [Anaerolineae bacterium]|nr:MBL fold metallo-hydrolase [Phycisphaerae bacterium]
MSEIELIMLGTGTSAGIPMIGCHCSVCESTDPHDKRSRPSALVSYDDLRIVIDTSPELRLQCIANRIDMIHTVVFTHAHADHVMGLDDVRRFNAISGQPIDIWANEQTHAAVGRCFDYAFLPPHEGPRVFRPQLTKRVIDGPFRIGSQAWIPIPLVHGEWPVLGFRVGGLAYCTDVSAIPEDSWSLLRDLDVLVLDALQIKKHPAHFNLEEAVDAAKRIGAGVTLFTHIAHGMAHAATNATLPANMRLAFDGERVIAHARRGDLAI